MGQMGQGQEASGQVDQDSPGEGKKKGSSECSGLTYILRPGEWDGTGRWVQF